MAKAKVSEFVTYVTSKVGSAYLWGGQGETLFELTKKLAKQNGQSEENTEAMFSFMKSQGIKDIAFFDCSGLGVSYLLMVRAIAYDMTADELYRRCTKIKKNAIRPGDMAFFLDSNGKAYHVAYLTNRKTVVHAFNQFAGVIEEPVSLRQWVFGRPDFCLEYDLEEPKKDVNDLKAGDTVAMDRAVNGYNTAADALAAVNPVVPYPAGNYYVYKVYNGAVNITRKKGVPGVWVVL